MNKKRFRQFLGRLYNARMADRVVNLFDFVNPLDLVVFVKQVEDIFFGKGVVNQESAGRHLKVLAF